MRVMVIIKADKKSEAGIQPTKETKEMFVAMGKFNEELVKAGMMLAGDGLQPSSKGKRVKFSGQQRTVIDGPFTEAKELIAGFWLWQVKSMDEAVEWLKRAPFDGAPRSRSGRYTKCRISPRTPLLPNMPRVCGLCGRTCRKRPQSLNRSGGILKMRFEPRSNKKISRLVEFNAPRSKRN